MSEHRPIELSINPPECCAETCDHDTDGHPESIAIACEACTFTKVDVGMDDVIIPVPWPCEHGRPVEPDMRPSAVDGLIAAVREYMKASGRTI